MSKDAGLPSRSLGPSSPVSLRWLCRWLCTRTRSAPILSGPIGHSVNPSPGIPRALRAPAGGIAPLVVCVRKAEGGTK